MKTIHKYTLDITGRQEIEMPIGAEILTLQVQRGIPVFWAKVQSDAATEKRIFKTILTGHSIEELGKSNYIGTYQINEDRVFHVFEITNL